MTTEEKAAIEAGAHAAEQMQRWTAGLDLTPAGGDASARDLIDLTEDRMTDATSPELPGLCVALDAMEAAASGADLIELLISRVARADEGDLPGLEAALESVLHFGATPAYEVVAQVREEAQR